MSVSGTSKNITKRSFSRRGPILVKVTGVAAESEIQNLTKAIRDSMSRSAFTNKKQGALERAIVRRNIAVGRELLRLAKDDPALKDTVQMLVGRLSQDERGLFPEFD